MVPQPRIAVDSISSMADEKLRISLNGLDPRAEVTLKMNTTTDEGLPFTSFGRFKANSSGCVDLSRDQSCGGSYSGIDQMGLFWSLEPASEEAAKWTRYQKLDVTKPMKFSLFLYNIDVTSMEDLNQLQSDGKLEEFELDSCEFERLYVKADVTIEEKTYEEDGFTGTLYLPPGEGPHPGVVTMLSARSETQNVKVSLLASRGFATLQLHYYAPTIDSSYYQDGKWNVDLGYFKKAVDVMIRHPKIISSGVGVMSTCHSVHIALLMATYFDHIHCVVAMNGEVTNFKVIYHLGNKIIEGSDYGYWDKLIKKVKTEPTPLTTYDLYEKHSISEVYEMEGKGLIPFYNKKDVGFMMIAGLDDKFIPAEHYADLFKILLEDAKHPNFEVHKYVGAGHLIEPPYGPLNNHMAILRRPVLTGGSPLPNAIANEDAWSKQIEFLRKNIIGQSTICTLKQLHLT